MSANPPPPPMMTSILNHHRLLLDAASSTSTPTNTTTTTFDATMVIILAALLCALVCALGLNSIVRCAIRCTRRLTSMDPAEEVAVARFTAAAARGVAAKRDFHPKRRIPATVYGAEGVKVVGGADCSICLGEFVGGDKIRVLPRCCHGFHVRCIDAWLVSHSSCPTCRRSLAAASLEDGRGVQTGEDPTTNHGGGGVREEGRVTVVE